MKSVFILFILLLLVSLVYGQPRATDLTGIWVIKKSSTITVDGGLVLKEEGLHMMDTLNFMANGTFIFMLTPPAGSLTRRTESGDWRIDDHNLILFNRMNHVGQPLPKEQLLIKMKRPGKLRIYFNIGGMAAEHYEHFTKIMTDK